MKEFFKKLLAAIVILLFSPVIALGLLIMFFEWLREPARKKEYSRSHYYLDLRIPYRRNILNMDSYRLYNEAKDQNLSVHMVHPSNDGPDYLIVQNSIFLFPMCSDVFGGIAYNTVNCEWEVDLDGEDYSLDDEWEKYKSKITETGQGLPCYLLIRQSDLHPCFHDSGVFMDNYALEKLPPYVRVVQEYTDIITGG